jgi:type IV secretory pathway VirB6-like protein
MNLIVKYSIIILLHLLISCDYNPVGIDHSDFGEPKSTVNKNGEIVKPITNLAEYSWLQATSSSFAGVLLKGDEEIIGEVSGVWTAWEDGGIADQDDLNRKCSFRTPETGLCKNSPSNMNTWRACKFATEVDEANDENNPFQYKYNNAIPGTLHEYYSINNELEPYKRTECWFTAGKGVYISFAVDKQNGKEIFYHIGDPSFMRERSESAGLGCSKKSWCFVIPQDEINNILQELGATEHPTTVKLYTKLENYAYSYNAYGQLCKDSDGSKSDTELAKKFNYDDNTTSYCKSGGTITPRIYKSTLPLQIYFKKGVTTSEYGILEEIFDYFLTPLKGITETIYKGLINNDVFKRLLILAVTFYIIFLAIGFFLGTTQMTHGQLMTSLIRIAIIYTLLNPAGGWSFFHEYFYRIFWDFSNTVSIEFMKVFYKITDLGDYAPMPGNQYLEPIKNLNDLLDMFLATEVHLKILGMLFAGENGLGFVVLIITYFAIFVFIIAVIKFTLAILFIYMTLFILFSLAPIFIVLSLFNYTRNYFEQWLKMLIAAAIQPVILFLFITIFASTIFNFFRNFLAVDSNWETLISIWGIDIFKFWKITKTWKYDELSSTWVELGAGFKIDWGSVIMLLVIAKMFQYLTAMIPKIAERLSEGFSLGAMNNVAMKAGDAMGSFAQNMTKNTLSHINKKTFGAARVAALDKVSTMSQKALTGGDVKFKRLAKYGSTMGSGVKGTKAYDMKKAGGDIKKFQEARGIKSAKHFNKTKLKGFTAEYKNLTAQSNKKDKAYAAASSLYRFTKRGIMGIKSRGSEAYNETLKKSLTQAYAEFKGQKITNAQWDAQQHQKDKQKYHKVKDSMQKSGRDLTGKSYAKAVNDIKENERNASKKDKEDGAAGGGAGAAGAAGAPGGSGDGGAPPAAGAPPPAGTPPPPPGTPPPPPGTPPPPPAGPAPGGPAAEEEAEDETK